MEKDEHSVGTQREFRLSDSLMKLQSCKAAVTQGLIASTCHSKSAAPLSTIVVGEIKKNMQFIPGLCLKQGSW